MDYSDIKIKIIEYLQGHSQPVSLFQLVNIVFQGRYSSSVIDNALSQLFEAGLFTHQLALLEHLIILVN